MEGGLRVPDKPRQTGQPPSSRRGKPTVWSAWNAKNRGEGICGQTQKVASAELPVTSTWARNINMVQVTTKSSIPIIQVWHPNPLQRGWKVAEMSAFLITCWRLPEMQDCKYQNAKTFDLACSSDTLTVSLVSVLWCESDAGQSKMV